MKRPPLWLVALAAALLLTGCPATTDGFPTCEAAEAASAAPVRSGDPGWNPDLDRDGDGVACE